MCTRGWEFVGGSLSLRRVSRAARDTLWSSAPGLARGGPGCEDLLRGPSGHAQPASLHVQVLSVALGFEERLVTCGFSPPSLQPLFTKKLLRNENCGRDPEDPKNKLDVYVTGAPVLVPKADPCSSKFNS